MIARLLCLVGLHAPFPAPVRVKGNRIAWNYRCLACRKAIDDRPTDTFERRPAGAR